MSQKSLLSSLERTVYETVLKLGDSPVAAVISESKLKRATVYKTLYTLEEKGLVSKRDIGKKIHFRPESPARLLELAELELQTAKEQKDSILSLIPMFSSLYTSSTQRPVVKVYEGVEGLKKIYLDMIKTSEIIYAALETSDVEEELFDWLTGTFVKKRVQAKVHAKVIVASGSWAKEYKERDIEEYRTTVLVPSETFPFQHEIDIYGDRVAFVHYRKDEPLIGIVVTHPNIAKTMKAMFNLAWIGASNHSNAQ